MKYDLLIRVPRAGLMFANFMAMQLSIPLSTPELLPNFWPSSAKVREDGPIRNILIVEDMTAFGTQIIPLKKKVQELFPQAIVHVGAVYSPEGGIKLDSYGARINDRSITEWDFLNEKVYENVAVDMDGVLCQDCPSGLTEDQFVQWMQTAVPYLIPRFRVQTIITSRLEKYRPITDQWLTNNGAQYYQLLMDPSKTLSERDLIGWKVHCINWRKPHVFIESDNRTAQEIHWKTGIPVICVSTMEIYSK